MRWWFKQPFWRDKGAVVDERPPKPKVYKPWQIRQWLGLDDKGKPLRQFMVGVDEMGKPIFGSVPNSLETRQRKRAALRKLCMTQITEKYGQESRIFRRRIARRLAVKAFGEINAKAA
jgi:hypothetical protein